MIIILFTKNCNFVNKKYIFVLLGSYCRKSHDAMFTLQYLSIILHYLFYKSTDSELGYYLNITLHIILHYVMSLSPVFFITIFFYFYFFM